MQIRRWFTSWSAKPISAMIKKDCDCVSQIPCSISPQTQPRTPFSFASVCAIATVGRWVKQCPTWATLTFTNHSPIIHPTSFPLRFWPSPWYLGQSWSLPAMASWTSFWHSHHAICHYLPPYATSRNLQVPRQIESCQFSSRHWLSEMYRPQQVRFWEIRQGPFHGSSEKCSEKFDMKIKCQAIPPPMIMMSTFYAFYAFYAICAPLVQDHWSVCASIDGDRTQNI